MRDKQYRTNGNHLEFIKLNQSFNSNVLLLKQGNELQQVGTVHHIYDIWRTLRNQS